VKEWLKELIKKWSGNKMEEVIIYEFQLKVIQEALRLTANMHNSHKGETCFDRQIRQAEQYANNALDGKIDKEVKYM